jgi:hypothetical protein
MINTTESALAHIFGGHKHDWARTLALPQIRKLHGYPIAPGGTTWVQEQAIIAAVCGHLKPEVAVESGVLWGESLRAARLLHVPRVHLAFDHDPVSAPYAEERGVDFHLTDWRNIGDVWPDPELKWNYAFIDSEHTKEAVYGQLEILEKFMADDAVVMAHDCDPDVSGLYDSQGLWEWACERSYPSYCLNTPAGLGVVLCQPIL